MNNQKDSFIFYRSFFEAINNLKPLDRLKIYDAIANYSLNFEEVELTGITKTIFILIKPQLEANNKRYINGCKGADSGIKGGRPKNIKPQDENIENPKETPKKPQSENLPTSEIPSIVKHITNNKDIEINKELKNNESNKEKYIKENQSQNLFSKEELLFEDFYKLYNSLEEITDRTKNTRGYNKTKHRFISKIKKQNIDFKDIINGTQDYLQFIELEHQTGFNRALKDIDTFINQCSWEGDKGISWKDKISQKLDNVSKIINIPTINELKKELKEQELYKINTDIPF